MVAWFARGLDISHTGLETYDGIRDRLSGSHL